MNYARLSEADKKLSSLQEQLEVIIRSQLSRDESPKELDLIGIYKALGDIRADVQVSLESAIPIDNLR